ncbi:MAG TPA: hypothetical protein VFP97_05135 [Chitinophagaceae bacterium]|nr:hypothetical protein [Chitinophagaceae bacterium]
MLEFLFAVEQTIMIPDRGLVLIGGPRTKDIQYKSRLKLVLPDKTEIHTEVWGEGAFENFAIAVDNSIQKQQVPIGTEAWLCD